VQQKDNDLAKQVFEVNQLQPQLRLDLGFTLQRYGEESSYLVEDPIRSKYYRLGVIEYYFVSLLDGKTTIQQALAVIAREFGADAFDEQDAISVIRWLSDTQLFVAKLDSQAEPPEQSIARGLQRLNPLVFKLPLGNPDGIVTWVWRYLGWITHPAFFLLWIGLAVLAGQQLINHSASLYGDLGQVLSPANWVCLLAAWLGLKFVHEMYHSLICKRYGGRVAEAGIVFVLLAPLPYVDVSSAWRFPSKWPRIYVSLAGVIAELVIASLAAVVWCQTAPGVVHQTAYNVMLMATVVTLVFNANPLMRFDGYYVLADYVEIPNLYSVAQQRVTSLLKSLTFGATSRLPHATFGTQAFLLAFGLATVGWRVVVCTSLMVGAHAIFGQLGLALSLFALAGWTLPMLWNFVKYLWRPPASEQASRIQFTLTMMALATLCFFGLHWIDAPVPIQAPAIVMYENEEHVRAGTSGFVLSLEVHAGDFVRANQVIARLEDPQLLARYEGLRLQQKSAALKCNLHRQRGEMAAYQAERNTVAALGERLDVLQEQRKLLELRAQRSGIVVGDLSDDLLGRYVRPGTSLCKIVSEEEKRIVVSVAAEDLAAFDLEIGKNVAVRPWVYDSPIVESKLENVQPKAQITVPVEALAAYAGGPLEVVMSSSDDDSDSIQWKLLEPRFEAVVSLDAETSKSLRAGQRAYVRLNSQQRKLGSYLYNEARQWVRRRFLHATG
jgi:putative peptide zinc metalloprotease protein